MSPIDMVSFHRCVCPAAIAVALPLGSLVWLSAAACGRSAATEPIDPADVAHWALGCDERSDCEAIEVTGPSSECGHPPTRAFSRRNVLEAQQQVGRLDEEREQDAEKRMQCELNCPDVESCPDLKPMSISVVCNAPVCMAIGGRAPEFVAEASESVRPASKAKPVSAATQLLCDGLDAGMSAEQARQHMSSAGLEVVESNHKGVVSLRGKAKLGAAAAPQRATKMYAVISEQLGLFHCTASYAADPERYQRTAQQLVGSLSSELAHAQGKVMWNEGGAIYALSTSGTEGEVLVYEWAVRTSMSPLYRPMYLSRRDAIYKNRTTKIPPPSMPEMPAAFIGRWKLKPNPDYYDNVEQMSIAAGVDPAKVRADLEQTRQRAEAGEIIAISAGAFVYEYKDGETVPHDVIANDSDSVTIRLTEGDHAGTSCEFRLEVGRRIIRSPCLGKDWHLERAE